MSETMIRQQAVQEQATQEPAIQEPALETTTEGPSIETDDAALAEPLIEEISIDGMCGVY